MPEQTKQKANDNLVFSLVQQAIVMVLASMLLDGGVVARIVIYAIAAYWTGFVIAYALRHHHWTAADRILARWGFLILCPVSGFVTGLVWRIKGF